MDDTNTNDAPEGDKEGSTDGEAPATDAPATDAPAAE